MLGAPIAALYAALWTPEARKAFPALEDMHNAECDPLESLFEGMSNTQVHDPAKPSLYLFRAPRL